MGPVGRLETMAPRALPPLFVWPGDADPMIAHGQSERLAKALAKVFPATRIDFAVLPGGGHGGGDFATEAVLGTMRDFLIKVFGA